MSKTAMLLATLLALVTAPSFAQVVVSSRPVVTYYAPAVATFPAPVTTYYAPSYSTSRVVYDAPVTVSRPVTSFLLVLRKTTSMVNGSFSRFIGGAFRRSTTTSFCTL